MSKLFQDSSLTSRAGFLVFWVTKPAYREKI